jgi:hypothetical protein
MLAGCGDLSSAKRENGSDNASRPAEAGAGRGFPRAGTYDIVRESAGRPAETSTMWVDASNRAAFEALVAGPDGSACRDRQVSIGGGSFSVRMTCDAPDGDIHNIAIQRSGSYSESAIRMTTDTILWGHPIRETASYRFRQG